MKHNSMNNKKILKCKCLLEHRKLRLLTVLYHYSGHEATYIVKRKKKQGCMPKVSKQEMDDIKVKVKYMKPHPCIFFTLES